MSQQIGTRYQRGSIVIGTIGTETVPREFVVIDIDRSDVFAYKLVAVDDPLPQYIETDVLMIYGYLRDDSDLTREVVQEIITRANFYLSASDFVFASLTSRNRVLKARDELVTLDFSLFRRGLEEHREEVDLEIDEARRAVDASNEYVYRRRLADPNKPVPQAEEFEPIDGEFEPPVADPDFVKAADSF